MKDPRSMSWSLALSLASGIFLQTAVAQDSRIYRCDGNQYTNKPAEMQGKHCKLVDGGNVTVVQAPAPAKTATSKSRNSDAAPEKSTEQKSRDSDAKLILEDELRKSEQRLAELKKEYNNGEPEKLGPEHKNHQKYLDRVAELKTSIERSESDIAGIKRELSRLR